MSTIDGEASQNLCFLALQCTQQPLPLCWMPEPSQFFLVCFQFRASPFFLATAPHNPRGFVPLVLLLTSAAAPPWVPASRSPGLELRSSVPTVPPAVLTQAVQASIVPDPTQLLARGFREVSVLSGNPVASSLFFQISVFTFWTSPWPRVF